MKIAQINMVPFGSTGKIMFQIADLANSLGHEVRTFSTIPYSKRKAKIEINKEYNFIWGSHFENCVHYYLGTIFGANGCFSFRGTRKLIKKLREFQPDIIHLHNLHQYCINLKLLFTYLKNCKAKIIWTLHDCWAFTGKCPYFEMVNCTKWMNTCFDCPQLKIYPKSLIDTSKIMYKKKKKLFCGINNLVIVTPSNWLKTLVQKSFLKEYPVFVINNGIDLSIFYPQKSNFRNQFRCNDKFIILGVAFGWSERKGIDVFIALSKKLPCNQFSIVLVGTDENIDKMLPENIISIHATQNQNELAQIYSTADLFVNPTREDNYPTVNMESIACGTPVLTFNTGGSPEIINNECGWVVNKNNVEELEKKILWFYKRKPFTESTCLKHAKSFDMKDKYLEYIKLYENCTHCS